jgi:hypothetical protein
LYTIDNNVQRIIDYALLPNGTEYFTCHTGNDYTEIRLIQKGKKYKLIKKLSNLHTIGYVQLFQNNDNSMLFNDGSKIFSISSQGNIKPITQKLKWLTKVINSQVDNNGSVYFCLISDYSINGIYTYTEGRKTT